MKNMLLGILLTALVFSVLAWATTKRTVHAEVLTAPPAGRFQLVQLHPAAGIEWSGILDTETGCTWVFSTNSPNDPKITNEAYKSYLQVLGEHDFELVNYNPMEYTIGKTNPDNTMNYTPYVSEITRVQFACSHARLHALDAAGGR